MREGPHPNAAMHATTYRMLAQLFRGQHAPFGDLMAEDLESQARALEAQQKRAGLYVVEQPR